MTVRNDNLIQKCFRKVWTLSEFLRLVEEEEIISLQIAGMRYNESEIEVRIHDFQQTCAFMKTVHVAILACQGYI